jgi:ribonucleoside-diphosphate reductase alpha chain
MHAETVNPVFTVGSAIGPPQHAAANLIYTLAVVSDIQIGNWKLRSDQMAQKAKIPISRNGPRGDVEEQSDASLPALSDNARAVLARRYLRKDEQGHPVESPADMFRRVARHVAQAEKQYGGDEAAAAMEKRFFNLMTDLKFLPNSPTLMNAGRRLGQLAACFVLPVEDRMEGIFDALKQAAIIHKSGGGTGFSFSRLRPKNSKVGTTGGVASGPVSFMKIFNTATEQVKQGGTRRGANMAILRVDHPDIMEFIQCKENDSELNNFNISVGITDAFMQALKEGADYDLVDPREKRVVGRASSLEVYQTIVHHAWKNGDPGIVFLDRINRDNPTPELGEIESTNPCGEQPLLPMESCNLGSINLAKFVSKKNGAPAIDYGALKKTIHQAVRFLDDVIDMSRYPIPEIERMVKGNRKIGLGVMGFADMLFQLGIAYDSENGIETAETLMKFFQETARDASRELAAVRGTFQNYDRSIFKQQEGCAFRNATTTTIAPTGSLSIIAGCSSGIEPLFALSFTRTIMDNDEMTEVNPYFEAAARSGGFYSPELMKAVAKTGSIRDIDGIPEEVKRVFVTAHDISPEWHVRMQAAFQKYTDNAVSKTVNLPGNADPEDVVRVYDLAYSLGCKGVTIYRDGSKDRQVLAVSKTRATEKPVVKDRPETLYGFTTKIRTGLGDLYVTVTEMDGLPFEVFATIGKSGRSTTAKTEAIGRLISLAFRSGIKVEKVVEQLKGIGGEHPVFQKGGIVRSIPDAISQVLENRYLGGKNGRKNGSADGAEKDLMGTACPECGENLSFEEGCMLCHFCGYSKCG